MAMAGNCSMSKALTWQRKNEQRIRQHVDIGWNIPDHPVVTQRRPLFGESVVGKHDRIAFCALRAVRPVQLRRYTCTKRLAFAGMRCRQRVILRKFHTEDFKCHTRYRTA